MRWAGPWPWVHDRDPAALVEPALDVPDGAVDVTAVGVDRLRRQHPARHGPGEHVDVDAHDVPEVVAQR